MALELIHIQQPRESVKTTLLQQALNEGGADFMGEMISGGIINRVQRSYEDAHEQVLWTIQFAGPGSSADELHRARISVCLIFLIHGILVSNWLSRIPAVQAKLHILYAGGLCGFAEALEFEQVLESARVSSFRRDS